MKKIYLLTVLLLMFFVKNNLFAQCLGTLTSGNNFQTVCINTPIVDIQYIISGTTLYNISGLPPGVTSTSAGALITIAGTPTGAGNFNYTINYIGCPLFQIPSSGTIQVNPRPTANVSLTGAASICPGETSSILLTFTGTAPWSGHLMGTSNDPFVLGVNTFPVIVTPSATVNYTVSDLFDGSGCAATSSELTGGAAIFVKPLPQAPAVVSPVNYCVGATAASLTATGDSLLWYNPPGNNVAVELPDPNPPATDIAGTTHYFVTQTENGCQSPKAEIIVIVDAIPAPPEIATPITYCDHQPPISLNASGDSLLWYTNSTGGTGNPDPPIPQIGTDSFYVTQTVNGCESPRAQTNVTVNPRPQAYLDLAGPSNICQGDTTQLVITFPPSNGTGTYYGIIDTSNINFIANSSPYYIPVAPAITTSYHLLTLTNTLTGCHASGPDDLFGFEIIHVALVPDAPGVTTVAPVCQGTGSITLAASGTGSLLWYTTAVGGSGISVTPIVSTAIADTSFYYVSQTENGCESPRSEIVVVVKPTPVMTPVADKTYCNGEQVNGIDFSGTPTDIEFNWHCSHSVGFGTGPVTANNISSFFAQNFSQLSDTSEVIVQIKANGCTGISDSFNIVVNPSPDKPEFKWLNGFDSLCLDSRNINFNVISPINGVSYLWNTEPLNDPGIFIQDVNSANTVLSFLDPGFDTILVFAINPPSLGGCKDSVRHVVKVSNADGIEERRIFKKQPGNLLIYPDNSMNTLDGYQWGYDSLMHIAPDTAYGPPVMVPGQVYQFFIPDERFIINNELDTVNYAFWVLLHKGDCYSRVYYNGPYATGRMQDVPQEDNTAQLNLFPNPNNGIFDIVLKGDIYGSIDARIYNAMGQLVFTNNFSKTVWEMHKKFNAGKLSGGFYYMVLRSSDLKKLTTRFIIQQ